MKNFVFVVAAVIN